jgi:hypothetical protein
MCWIVELDTYPRRAIRLPEPGCMTADAPPAKRIGMFAPYLPPPDVKPLDPPLDRHFPFPSIWEATGGGPGG